jgi:hypothetical protein
VNNELEMVWKVGAVAQSRKNPSACLESLAAEERKYGVLVYIQSEQLLNAIGWSYS